MLTAAKENKIVTLVLIVVVFITVSLTIFVPATRPAKVEAPIEQTAPVNEELSNKVVDGMLDALMRVWPITDACYDTKAKVFLTNTATHTPVEGRLAEGWHMEDSYEFVELQNGTYVLKSVGEPISVVPDVTGLRCKQQDKLWK